VVNKNLPVTIPKKKVKNDQKTGVQKGSKMAKNGGPKKGQKRAKNRVLIPQKKMMNKNKTMITTK
jgi:hypothetical protein